MSIMIIDKENLASTYKYLYENQGKINNDIIEKEDLQEIFDTLYEINITVFNNRYNEDINIEKINFNEYADISRFQALKYLDCLDYQIEIEYIEMTEKQADSYDYLQNTIKNLREYIINNTPEYKKCKWN